MEQIITLEQIFNPVSLKKVWKRIKSQLSQELLRDPIDNIAYEAHLDHNLGYLSYRVKNERYAPSSQTIVRSAKNNGLTRPLAFLDIEDQLILKAICDNIERQLLYDFPLYVNYGGRSQTLTAHTEEQSEGVMYDYESWFDRWMRHQTIINKFIAIESRYNFLVKTDITNFFPTINLDILRKVILTRVKVDETIVNLLFYLLYDMVPRPHYALEHKMGLPQENYDASRLLAHSFLKPVDDFFSLLGNEGRYVRWVDDILFAVIDENEGKKYLSGLQITLEQLGLNINSAKTKIVSKENAQNDLFLELNSFLEKVHEQTVWGEADLVEFDEKLRVFLEFEPTGGWERILRRFYTQSRRIGSSLLEDLAWNHLVQFPGSVPKILDYLESRPYSQEIEDGLWGYLSSDANLYEDNEIQIFEYLLASRIPVQRAGFFTGKILDYFFSRNEFSQLPLCKDYTRALISMLLYKIGGYDELKQIRDFFINGSERHFVRYAYVVLMATDQFRENARNKAMVHEDLVLRRLASFIEEIIKSPAEHLKLLKNYLKPSYNKMPDRYFLDSRALPIIKISGSNAQFRATEWIRIVDNIIERLKNKTNQELRDELLIRWLEIERQRV